MRLPDLAKLAKLGGVPAVALGILAVLFATVPEALQVVPLDWRGPILLVTILGAVILAVAAVAAWGVDKWRNAQVAETRGDNSPASNEDRTKSISGQYATTTGDRSPAINKRG